MILAYVSIILLSVIYRGDLGEVGHTCHPNSLLELVGAGGFEVQASHLSTATISAATFT